ncbi:MAG: slipin family protein [Planctomycetota bacterium]|jgi:regulator of protease activity HflC (stomatin/prohibitin superfamily)
MISKIRIQKHELGLWFRHGDFKGVLEPGAYALLGRLIGRDQIEIVDTLKSRFRHQRLEALVLEEQLQSYMHIVDLNDEQRALIWKDGRLAEILGPGRYVYWKQPSSIQVEVFDSQDLRFEHSKLDTILSNSEASSWLQAIRVEDHEKALLFVDGEYRETLAAGLYAYWRAQPTGKVTWRSVDLRESNLEVSGQEIMTADKVTLRLNLLVTYQVSDVWKALSTVEDYQQTLYREAQLVLRSSVGTRKLEELLADKVSVGDELRQKLSNRAAEFGVEIKSIGLRDLILPGDMKSILNQVIEAEKRAEANLIRRREETAAARNQANTAKLLAANPVLVRMKELEALQEILAGTKATFVLGSGDLPEQIRGLVGGFEA